MRRKRQARSPRLSEEQAVRVIAAQLIGARVISGLAPEAVLEHFGYTHKGAPRAEKRGLNAAKWAVYRLAVLEASLVNDPRLSTLQRYARAVGVMLRPQVTRHPSIGRVQRAIMRSVRRKGVLKSKTTHSNRSRLKK